MNAITQMRAYAEAENEAFRKSCGWNSEDMKASPDEVAQRRHKVATMKARGMKITEIMEQLGLTKSTVAKDLACMRRGTT